MATDLNATNELDDMEEIDVEEIKPGDRIDLGVDTATMKAHKKQLENAQTLMREGARMYRLEQVSLFEIVRAHHPELDMFDFTIDHKERVLIVSKRRDLEWC